MSLPYASSVMLSGSGPRRTFVSSASIVATWSFDSSKSNTSKFSAMRQEIAREHGTSPAQVMLRSSSAAGAIRYPEVDEAFFR
jgi:hypothetical protein